MTTLVTIPDAAGFAHALVVCSTHRTPTRDEVVVLVESLGQQHDVLLSRARVEELHAALGEWLERGWPGVQPVQGPTSFDVIRHWQDVATRQRVDHERAMADLHRQLDAAIALIPPERRSVDLADVVEQQSALWHRLDTEHRAAGRALAKARGALFEIGWGPARGGELSRDGMIRVAQTVHQATHPGGAPTPDAVPEAPVYDVQQLDLFDALAEVA